MRTLLAAGFEVTRVERKPNYLALSLVRPNVFGSRIKYLVAYAGDRFVSEADVEGLEKLSLREPTSLVVVSGNTNVARNSVVVLTKSKLFSLMGGVVSSVLPLEPEFGDQLTTLAKNQLPDGVTGEPDDLFEAYVHA